MGTRPLNPDPDPTQVATIVALAIDGGEPTMDGLVRLLDRAGLIRKAPTRTPTRTRTLTLALALALPLTLPLTLILALALALALTLTSAIMEAG